MIRRFALVAAAILGSASASAQCTYIDQNFESVPLGTVVSTLPGWSAFSSPLFLVDDSPFTGSRVARVTLPINGSLSGHRRLPPAVHGQGRISIDLHVLVSFEILIRCTSDPMDVGDVGRVKFVCEPSGLTAESRGVITPVPGGTQTFEYVYDTQGMITISYAGIQLDSYPWSLGTGNCSSALKLIFHGIQRPPPHCQGSITFDNLLVQSAFGTSYCAVVPNSTGLPAELCATGSADIAATDLNLMARRLPPQSMAYFLVSPTQGFNSNLPNSYGHLCLAGSVGRFVGPGQIQNSGAGGTVSLPVDLGMVPQPNGPVAAASGESWNFQLWFRDVGPAGVASSNFTNGFTVVATQ